MNDETKRKTRRKHINMRVVLAVCLCLFIFSPTQAATKSPRRKINKKYISFFEEVYKVIDDNYYFPVTRKEFNYFLDWFERNIYRQLENKKQISNFVKWRSAAYMVDFLKSPDDRFSAFFPPKYADKFEKKVLGKKVDLGIIGKMVKEGYQIIRLEPRSDAYIKGLRKDDIIRMINGVKVTTLSEEAIQELLAPLKDTIAHVVYIDHATKKKKTIEITSKEYFKQSVFMVPVDVPDVCCLEIRTFNRKTSEDMFRYLSLIGEKEESSLILDLRGNPGGPPLAAREISAFFLPPEEEFVYFQKKDQPKAVLTVPRIPQEYHYKGPLAILVNEESGSASELFSGILQNRKRAVLIGKNTAGQVLLKSMFNFDDESMILLVTARGHFPDGTVFDFSGLAPDLTVDDEDIDLIHFAAVYLTKQK